MTYIKDEPSGFLSGWKLYNINNVKGSLKIVQDRGKIDQSSNELITETFGVDGMLFICIENRILQYDRRACEEMTKKYDPILGFITSVSVNKDIILLGNVQNKIMYLSYREETRVRPFSFLKSTRT